MENITKNKFFQMREIVSVFAEAVKTAGEIPSGHLYAMVMGKFTLEQFNTIIGVLKDANLITEKNHLLSWVGRDAK